LFSDFAQFIKIFMSFGSALRVAETKAFRCILQGWEGRGLGNGGMGMLGREGGKLEGRSVVEVMKVKLWGENESKMEKGWVGDGVTNPSTSRPLFSRISPPFNLIPPSNPLFTSFTQPLWLLGCPQMSYTHTKTEVKHEPGIKVEDEGEDRDDERPAIMAWPGASDPDRILTASDKLWYTHMPSLSPNNDILNVHTPMPTPSR
jgi:hypothetical protein